MAELSDGSPQAVDVALIRDWLHEAGQIALAAYRQAQAVQLKQDGTPVTAVDHAVESWLLGRIRAHCPGHQVLTEESGAHGGSGEWLWVLDPLDGTRAFASGLPVWGIALGVLRQGEPLAGAFYLPALDEIYWGDRNGAFLNGQPLSSPSAASLDDPLAFLLVPSNSHLVYDIGLPRVRSLGSTAAHLIYVARGAAIGALTRRVKIWDLAGVLPILRHTGIELRYLSGAPVRIGDLLDGRPAPEPLLAAAPHLIEPLLAVIRPR
jgi:myo-inositol-1(or 4)-monophosphatase